jgi:hypothetical protein
MRLANGWDPETAITSARTIRAERRRLVITAFGETKSVQAWVNDPRAAFRHSYSILVDRLNRGWEPERAITVPIQFAQARQDLLFAEQMARAELQPITDAAMDTFRAMLPEGRKGNQPAPLIKDRN